MQINSRPKQDKKDIGLSRVHKERVFGFRFRCRFRFRFRFQPMFNRLSQTALLVFFRFRFRFHVALSALQFDIRSLILGRCASALPFNADAKFPIASILRRGV